MYRITKAKQDNTYDVKAYHNLFIIRFLEGKKKAKVIIYMHAHRRNDKKIISLNKTLAVQIIKLKTNNLL